MDEGAVLQKKALPNSIEMEQAVIGSMLMDRDAVAEVADILTKDDFYYGQYGLLYSAIVELYNEGKPIDLTLVSNKLKEMGADDSISNLSYIDEVMESVQFASHAGEYARVVQDKAVLRKMIRYSEATMAKCYESEGTVNDILEQSEKDLFDITQKRNTGMQFAEMKEIALTVLDNIEASAKKGSKITGVPTGFHDLDEKLTGLHGSELILIAARPAMGKTAFALNIALNASLKTQIPVAIFSLEMSKEQLATRLVAMDSMVDSQSIRTGQLLDSDWEKIMVSTYRVGETQMYIDDTPGITIAELRSKCRKLKQTKNIGLIVIDYLQLMSASGRSESRQQEISAISRSLKT
ncbi:MAG: replicative DNA helicase, partial [Lachnospiraceae bacterium]|nr:replicative DNA helicase [Lachnospiraceae bacterium]